MGTTMILLILLAICVINTIESVEDVRKCLYALFICGFAFSIYSVWFYTPSVIIDSLVSGTRLGGEINQENVFGLYNSITYLLAIYFGYKKKNLLYYLISVIPFLLAISSGSRKTLLILIAGTIFLILLLRQNKNFFKTLLTLGIICLAVYFVIDSGVFGDAFRRLEGLMNFFEGNAQSADASTLERKHMIDFGWHLFKQKPIFGYGANQYMYMYNSYFGGFHPAHNNYVQTLAEYGAVGFLTFYGMYAYIIYFLLKFKNESDTAKMLLVLYMICLINDMTACTVINKFTYIYLAIGFSYVRLLQKQKKKRMRRNICRNKFVS
jgi:O-antigen ligase